jgi:hypothetical protein
MAYFEGGTRNADVIAVSDGILAVITFEEINRMGDHQSVLQQKLLSLLALASIRKLRNMMPQSAGGATTNSTILTSPIPSSHSSSRPPSISFPAAAATTTITGSGGSGTPVLMSPMPGIPPPSLSRANSLSNIPKSPLQATSVSMPLAIASPVPPLSTSVSVVSTTSGNVTVEGVKREGLYVRRLAKQKAEAKGDVVVDDFKQSAKYQQLMV